MKWLDRMREHAKWRRELRSLSHRELRARLDHSVFHQTPGKHEWVEGWLWRRENLYDPIKVAPIVIAMLGVIAAYLALRK